MVAWIKWTPDGGIWLKRAPGNIKGMDGVMARGPVTFHEGDIDFPYWNKYLRDSGRLPPGEGQEEEPAEPAPEELEELEESKEVEEPVEPVTDEEQS